MFMLPKILTNRRIQFGSYIICILYIYTIYIYIHTWYVFLILRFLFPMLLTRVIQPEYLHWILQCPGEIIEFLRCIAAIISVLAMTSWGQETYNIFTYCNRFPRLIRSSNSTIRIYLVAVHYGSPRHISTGYLHQSFHHVSPLEENTINDINAGQWKFQSFINSFLVILEVSNWCMFMPCTSSICLIPVRLPLAEAWNESFGYCGRQPSVGLIRKMATGLWC